MLSIKKHQLPLRGHPHLSKNTKGLPAWEFGELVNELAPGERNALRYIAEYADVLIVGDTPYLLVQADAVLIEQLAAVDAAVADIEPEFEADELDTREGEDHEDREYTKQGFGNPMCLPGQEWWLKDEVSS